VDTYVVIVVLVGALLHAGWNTLVKAGGDKELDVALVHSLGALVCLPLLAWTGLPPREAWPFLAASLCIHVAYYVTLTGAYQHGELGATYPIMRGSAPMLVALGSATVLGESLSAAAWVGVCAITLGVMLVGLARPAEALHHKRAVGFALANACVIAGYTFVDGSGVRVATAAGSTAAAYVVLLFVLDGVPYPALVAWRRRASGDVGLRAPALAAGHARRPGLAGLLLDCAVGHDARARGGGVGAARDLGALCHRAVGARAQGALRAAAGAGSGGDRGRRGGAAPELNTQPRIALLEARC
jgi:drug/metabolite transporter (DMT)-like permease